MIDIRGLYKSFEDKTVLSDINASFENGKTNLIIGQSGSGKTVLMPKRIYFASCDADYRKIQNSYYCTSGYECATLPQHSFPDIWIFVEIHQ